MSGSWGSYIFKVVAAVLTAILTAIWSQTPNGFTINLLGGVSKSTFDSAVANFKDRPVPTSASYPTMKGMVVAFDSETCPDGWEYYAYSGGRFIVGAGQHNNRGLAIYNLHNTGGLENVTLAVPQIPQHKHNYNSLENGAGSFEVDSSIPLVGLQLKLGRRSAETTSTGSGQAHENRPPYIAMTFCKYAGSR